ncbi:unnamed protein product [Paramecium octaurelia]|uniref:Uncharacterized protein n=1 Tax=Paramecium octaurelia TaxID=43137 RepID=A0A8S1X093_PAROT|nr:unnamed protein product [Paramecium octaurelia]
MINTQQIISLFHIDFIKTRYQRIRRYKVVLLNFPKQQEKQTVDIHFNTIRPLEKISSRFLLRIRSVVHQNNQQFSVLFCLKSKQIFSTLQQKRDRWKQGYLQIQ